MLLINLFFIIAFFLMIAAISNFFIFPEYYSYENEKIEEEVNQLLNMIEGEIENLDLYCKDWALWTDTWNYVQDRNENYVESNLSEDSLRIGNLDFFLFISADGELVHAGWIDPETDGYYEDSSRETPVDYASLVYFPDADNSVERVKTGIINSAHAGDAYLFSSRNIFKSDRTGPSAGTLIAGRIIGQKMLNKLTSMMQYPIGLSRDITHDFVVRRTESKEPYLLSKKDDKNDRIWHVAVPQQNYQGETAIYLFFDHRIEIIDQGIRMVVLINAIILFTFLLLLGIQQVWLMRTVIIPITALNDYIEEQNSIFGEDFIFDSGLENEIGRLSRSFHFLFNKLYEKNRQLFFQASTDGLTGLSRRKQVMELLKDLCSINQAGVKTPFGVLMIDIDFFKRINDTYGHLTGDQVLMGIGPLIRSCLREHDIIGRFGGEEFIAVVQDIQFERIKPLAERIRESVEAQKWGFGEKVTVSIGFEFSGPPYIADKIIESADMFLYRAKKHGRNRVEGPQA